jgi:hypothetical protein
MIGAGGLSHEWDPCAAVKWYTVQKVCCKQNKNLYIGEFSGKLKNSGI